LDINDVEYLPQPHGGKLTNEEFIHLKEAKVSAVIEGEASEEPQQESKRYTMKKNLSLPFRHIATIMQILN
jgi:hypothetical protein